MCTFPSIAAVQVMGITLQDAADPRVHGGSGGAAEVLGSPPDVGWDRGCREPTQPQGAGWVLLPILSPTSGSQGSSQTQLRPQGSGDSLGTARPILGWSHPRTGRGKVLAGVLEHPETPLSPAPSPGPLGADACWLSKVMGPVSWAGDPSHTPGAGVGISSFY